MVIMAIRNREVEDAIAERKRREEGRTGGVDSAKALGCIDG